VSDSLDLLDQQFGRLGPGVEDSAGVEVGEELFAPGVDRAGEAVQLGDLGVGAVEEPAVEAYLGLCAVGGALVDQP